MSGQLAALLVALVPELVAMLPVARWAAVRRARAAGIVFGGPGAMVAARRVDLVFLDRWGTVTTGELVVTSIDPLQADDDRNLRWFAAALEHASDHPVGRAIARLAAPGRLSRVEEVPGSGIGGSVDRHPVRVGRPGWLGMDEREGLGVTVGVEVDHRPFGYLTVGDEVRKDAAGSVRRLRDLGLDLVLLSDDNARNTEDLAGRAGIEQWLSADLPEKRERLVRERQESGHVVAVAARAEGNAGLLAAADLALTVATSGAGVLVADLDAGRLAEAFGLARQARRGAASARWLGGAFAAAGVVLAAVGVLGVVPAAVVALVGVAATLVAATRSGER
ncbi:MAG: HAD family hydrolase [Nocardioidaceae bacterium]|nr:HAD family hydrolase [Nocardioidaceae bacterium]MCL2611832.1 HAD family hydrolase [Nocardioidaceae bacterium]